MALSLPLIFRRVPPNLGWGLRVPATFRDERVWYDANAATGREFFVLGVTLLLLALLPPLFGWREDAHALLWSGVLVAGVLTLLVVGWRRANRLLRQRHAERSS
jgi:hypothetical protein